MESVSIKFHHNSKVVALRAIISFIAPYSPVLTKHKCNSKVKLAVIDNLRFSMFFKHTGKFSYMVYGYICMQYIGISFILPYNNNTHSYEEEIHASEVIEGLNW